MKILIFLVLIVLILLAVLFISEKVREWLLNNSKLTWMAGWVQYCTSLARFLENIHTYK